MLPLKRADVARILARGVGYAAAVAGVALVTIAIAVMRATILTDLDATTVLYLVPVLFVALSFGTGPSLVASILSVVALDWLFVEPVESLLPVDSDALIQLLICLSVGVISGELVSRLHDHAELTAQREREMRVLYTLSSLAVRTESLSELLQEILEAFAIDLQLTGLALVTERPDGSTDLTVAGDVKLGGDVTWDRIHATLHSLPLPNAPPRFEECPGSGPGPTARILAIPSSGQIVAALVLVPQVGAPAPSDEQLRLHTAVAQQIGAAIERDTLRGRLDEIRATRKANEMKDAVLRAVTHDLRTPLALIKAAANNLGQPSVCWSDPERARFAAAIENNVDRLNRIVENLLDLSRIEAGMLGTTRAYFPIGDVIVDVVDRLGPLLGGHPVDVEVADDLPPVPIDYVAIDRVLSNLVENAVRHTPTGTPIEVRGYRDGGTVVVEVRDEGPGIPVDEQPRIFERFYRGRAARSDAGPGAGLGLAVARGLIEAHGGRLWVTSVPNVGSRFAFALPLSPMIHTSSPVAQEASS